MLMKKDWFLCVKVLYLTKVVSPRKPGQIALYILLSLLNSYSFQIGIPLGYPKERYSIWLLLCG